MLVNLRFSVTYECTVDLESIEYFNGEDLIIVSDAERKVEIPEGGANNAFYIANSFKVVGFSKVGTPIVTAPNA